MDCFDGLCPHSFFDLSMAFKERHADSIVKSYQRNPIISDVYISCRKEEILGLAGRNGSGKSTLLKIVFGSENADSKFFANKR